ncbi:coronatine-insensitive protein 1 isoform X2 [Physcomitrium patens]|uniref:F-box domain-containing protein n=1 Tax=Physcomitrium patens TaxID=3218 RepID=A0A2K1ITY6_PHYPA|nr:coronatine-insensitive protein 1-like isoform X2 [Physcomitrium patens]PNR32743.1 hypothetical protein PHYPA_024685 [Physcomitrium patens]|eukprot:XP_024357837.1 coronatine-insensitive protein 1-like isoform X2 [Physcomitrella patens]
MSEVASWGDSPQLSNKKGKNRLANESTPSTECKFNLLPEPIIESIFNRVEARGDRNAMSQVCKLWQKMDGMTRKNIYISNCYSIAPSDVSRRFKSLQKIKIKGKPRAYEFGLLVERWGGHAGPWIGEMSRAYPELLGLSMRRMDVTDNDLRILASRCPKLQKLKLHKCCGFSTGGLEHITRSCRTLRVLDIEESDDIEDTGGPWLELLENSDGRLESLNIASAGLEEENIKEVLPVVGRSLKCISSLKVSDMELGSFFKILDNSNVPVVELGLGCYCSSPEDPKELASSFALRLSKLRSAVGDRGMQVIGETCKQLKRIRVDQDTSEYMTDYITQKGMIAICEGCRELDFLVMYLSDVNNEALAAVGRCLPKLTDFRIVLLEVRNDVKDLPLDEGVRLLLQGCPILTRFSVYLRQGGLSDKGVGYIGQFGTKLKWVLLGCSGETDKGLRLMAEGCRQLERLELRCCPFTELQLASSILNSWRHLKYLWVQGVGATSGLGVDLVTHKSGFLVEFMGETQQILGYYSATRPRTDNPRSVCLINYVPPEDRPEADAKGFQGNTHASQGDAHSFYSDYADGYVRNSCSEAEAFYPGFNENNLYPDADENAFYTGVVDAGLYLGVGDSCGYPEFGEDEAFIY